MCSCGFGHRGESDGRGEWAGHLILTGKLLKGLTGLGQWICGSRGEGGIRETVVARELLFDIRRIEHTVIPGQGDRGERVSRSPGRKRGTAH